MSFLAVSAVVGLRAVVSSIEALPIQNAPAAAAEMSTASRSRVMVTFTTAARYLIWSYSENIGMYIAMTMKPTIAPTTMIMIGSMIAVSDLTAAATWSS